MGIGPWSQAATGTRNKRIEGACRRSRRGGGPTPSGRTAGRCRGRAEAISELRAVTAASVARWPSDRTNEIRRYKRLCAPEGTVRIARQKARVHGPNSRTFFGRESTARERRKGFNSLTFFPRDVDGARSVRAHRDFCLDRVDVPAGDLLRHEAFPAGPSDAAEGPHVRMRRGPRRRGADPVPLPVLHVRSDFRRLRCRGGVPPPLGVRMGRAPELRVAGGQVLDLPLPRDHVRRHPVRAQEGGGHPDMSTVVRGAPVVVSGRPVPSVEKEVLGGLKAAFGAKLLDGKVLRPGHLAVTIDRDDLIPVCTYLQKTIGFEHLSCITAVDWKDRFDCTYHIENYYNGCMVQVTAHIPYDDPKIKSLTGLWNAANYHEREAWDLMGIEFEGHPNLERILLPQDFKFHPLRKDFAQEVDRQYITRRKLRGGK